MVGQLLNWFGDNLPWTPIGRAVNEQRERAQMHQYRNQLMQRSQQEWDTQQAQLKAAQQTFTPGAPPPAQIPVTPPVGSPGYDQARQQLDQTNIGTASPVDYLKGPASAIAQGLAQAGQFNTAGQVLKEGIPQEPWKYGTVNGMMGQIEPGNQRFHPFPQASQTQDDISIRELNVGDNIRYGRFNKQGEFLGYVNDQSGGQIGGPRASRDESGPTGPFAGVGMQAQAHNMLLTGDPNTPEYAAAYNIASQPQVSFDANGRPVFVTPNMAWARKPGGPAAQPGAPPPGQPRVTTGDPTKPMEADRAVRVTNMQQAMRDAKTARDLFFPDGKYNRALAGQAMANIPLSKGRDANQAIRRAVEVLLRLRTGAAAPQNEVDSYAAMFSPSIFDSEEGAKRKMDQLQAFFDETSKLVGVTPDGGGGGSDEVPEGISPEEWNFLTPEEKAQWQR